MRVDDAQRLSRLIGEIYDTTLDSALWHPTLKALAEFVGGSNAALWSKDATGENGGASHMWGFDPGYVHAYFGEYCKLDPSASAFFVAGIGEPVTRSRLVPEAEFLGTRFYREWARPQGLVDCMQVTLDKTSTSLALFAVSRDKSRGAADERACRRMQLLAPHIRRAVMVSKATGAKQVEATALAEAFDGLRAGMLLVDGDGRIVHANRAAKAMIAEGDVFRSIGGRFYAHEPRVNHQLCAIFAAAEAGDAAIGTAGISLSLNARSGRRHVAHALPLALGLRSRAAVTYSAAVAVFVDNPTLVSPSPPETIARAFRLTPTELNVLLAIVEVGGVPEVAEFLGIAVSTVRTHLARIYDKTGTRRQADLVKVVAGYANRLIG